MRPEILNPLFEPVSSLDGIGPKLARNLARLLKGYEQGAEPRLSDLVFHLPHSVIDRREQSKLKNAREGEFATFKVRVGRHDPAPYGNNRAPHRVQVFDETGEMTLVFFAGRSDWIQKTLPVSDVRFISGKAEWFNNTLQMVHPNLIASEEEFAALPTIEPVYPLTAGLSNKVLGKAVRKAVGLTPQLPEWIYPLFITDQKWPDFRTALQQLHFPDDPGVILPDSPARRRLAHDELLAGQLAINLMREKMHKSSGKVKKGTGEFLTRLKSVLPFELTEAQRRSINEIQYDLAQPSRMLRLLQGDVGSGKTLVALAAALRVIECGEQAAIAAPTEILARQHLASLAPLCEKLGVTARLLTGKDKAAEKRETLAGLASGEIDLVIGTHAVFQSVVQFKTLGLAIVDEQHRFGVHQRLMLASKGQATDMLVMTATPIPRTLVLTHYGDMDVSKLDEKPPGRQPIQTNAVSSDRLEELIARVLSAAANGKKIYWICPLVEDSDEVDAVAAETRHADLVSRTQIPVGLVHGRMSVAEKDAAMADFKHGETKILVATTVIEVGVDVPDATIMVIEHAERFGLAQLHQLRGRVGRGSEASSCMLLYYAPLSETAQARLKIMRESEDGFRIAEEDLKLRGEGEVLGTRQSGAPGFSLASAEHHSDVLDMARDSARLIMSKNPELEGEEGEALRILLYLFGQDQAIRLLRAG